MRRIFLIIFATVLFSSSIRADDELYQVLVGCSDPEEAEVYTDLKKMIEVHENLFKLEITSALLKKRILSDDLIKEILSDLKKVTVKKIKSLDEKVHVRPSETQKFDESLFIVSFPINFLRAFMIGKLLLRKHNPAANSGDEIGGIPSAEVNLSVKPVHTFADVFEEFDAYTESCHFLIPARLGSSSLIRDGKYFGKSNKLVESLETLSANEDLIAFLDKEESEYIERARVIWKKRQAIKNKP